MKSLRVVITAGVVLLTGLLTSEARAAFVAFVEEGDVVVVQHDTNFECGYADQANGEIAHVDACWRTNSPPGFTGTGICYMVEPAGTHNGGSISDEIRINFTVQTGPVGPEAHMSIDFISDDDAAPPTYPPPNVPVIIEDGTSQFLNLSFFDPTTLAPIQPPANIEMRAQSDVEVVPTLPQTWSGIKARFN